MSTHLQKIRLRVDVQAPRELVFELELDRLRNRWFVANDTYEV